MIVERVGPRGGRDCRIDIFGAQSGIEEVVFVIEFAGKLVGGRKTDSSRADRQFLPLRFAAGPEERPVPSVVDLRNNDWTADCAGYGVISGGGAKSGSKKSGFERRIHVDPVEGPMELVRAGLCRLIDDAAGGAAVLRGIPFACTATS